MKSLLTDLDSNSYWFHTMYGIHGIDDNPTLHPYAEPANQCQSCSNSDQCGGVGNLCVGIGGDRACVTACTDDRGCSEGFRCTAIASQSSREVYDHACVPADFSCN